MLRRYANLSGRERSTSAASTGALDVVRRSVTAAAPASEPLTARPPRDDKFRQRHGANNSWKRSRESLARLAGIVIVPTDASARNAEVGSVASAPPADLR